MVELADACGLQEVAVCGSVARGQDTPGSDVDFYLVPGLHTTPTGWQCFRAEVEHLLGCRVDIIVDVGQSTPAVATARLDKKSLEDWSRAFAAPTEPGCTE